MRIVCPLSTQENTGVRGNLAEATLILSFPGGSRDLSMPRYALLSALLSNKIPWITEFKDRTPLPDSFSFAAIENANSQLSWMYSHLSRYLRRQQLVSHPSEILRANRDHRWSVSPFHYRDEYYRKALRGVLLTTDAVIF